MSTRKHSEFSVVTSVLGTDYVLFLRPSGTESLRNRIITYTNLEAALESRFSIVGHVHSTSQITSGTFANARISSGNVLQHGSTVGGNLFQLANPSAVRFLRVNSDNTVTALAATDFRTNISAAADNHTHAFSAITGRTSFAQLPSAVEGGFMASPGGNFTLYSPSGARSLMQAAHEVHSHLFSDIGGLLNANQLPTIATQTILGRILSGSGQTQQLSATDVRNIINVADGANNYVHPSGFSNQPGTALSGATVISQITVHAQGHVTGASTRNLTPANIGAAAASHAHSAGDITSGLMLNARIAESNVIQHATTIGRNFFQLANPGATTFIRMNSDNTITARTGTQLRSDIGAAAAFTSGAISTSGSLNVTEGRLAIGGATVIAHLTSAGHKHIPSGGTTNNYLRYGGSSGTAEWQTPEGVRNDINAAAIGGNSSVPFSVANATANAHAVSRAFGDGRYVRQSGGYTGLVYYLNTSYQYRYMQFSNGQLISEGMI